ncbi:L-seryl-tRNA(Sec) selenium transferase [Maridesulfovibrio hydrothermalis]|uniref:L-seryl-tRNA(Sec) selenium transferase n=1 Tax=Maridesulfovibrio hydrothermalis AM13 = DSM 14728 TaxID=1121451 RepID=L0RDA1_9BACT|nr:L-seryl-tRNA(Sec) selenium transferase [Maridesulfovibrio hydrothermalis]CCO24753.1 selenocysteine synthase [Maridesulfovibrio hydrothermalis AM13 = DSM 14728]
MSNLFKYLPSVDSVLTRLEEEGVIDGLPRTLSRDLVNGFLDVCREEIKGGIVTEEKQLSAEVLFPRLTCHVRAGAKPHFRRVLNGTGVVVHTNLGRSLLAESAVKAVAEACANYSNLEFDLKTGERGSRYSHVEKLICEITGAEAALVVNNNASAVLITLETLSKGRESVVSRGQLVEIGGSFRIPDVMTKSGAILHEVGATNRTHLRDYENAINDETALLMKVHTSNFRVIGFTKEVSGGELAELGRKYDLPVYEDLGSGNLTNFSGLGLMREPTVQEVVAEGVDIVSFSGDKVLGGPQAGIIVGTKKYIDMIKSNPLNRAVRIDKMTLAALEATLRLYLDPDTAMREVPTVRMIMEKPENLKTQARSLARVFRRVLGDSVKVGVREGVSRVGGGAFPEQDLKTFLVTVLPQVNISVEELKERLLSTEPPLVARIEFDAFCLDPRTLSREEYHMAAQSVLQALNLD